MNYLKGGDSMDSKSVVGKLEQRTSKKGQPYTCLVIKLTPTYEKIVFLTNAEFELLRK